MRASFVNREFNGNQGRTMVCIQNVTFDEIGRSATLSRTLAQNDISRFAAMSGAVNPAHMDKEFAKGIVFHKVIAHGMWGGALISAVLGTELPGPGTIYVRQTLRFLRPIYLGDTMNVRITVTAKQQAKHHVTFDCKITTQSETVVIEGSAEVIAPTTKICIERPTLPAVDIPRVEASRPSNLRQRDDPEPLESGGTTG